MALARSTQYCTSCRNGDGDGDSSEAGSQRGQEPGPVILRREDDVVQDNGSIRQCSDVASVVQQVVLSS